MKVTDLNGCQIKVTNLDEAIRITAEYKQYEHINDGFSDSDKRLNNYWTDMYEKLIKLKSKQNEQSRQ
jgi:hypothetical protein